MSEKNSSSLEMGFAVGFGFIISGIIIQIVFWGASIALWTSTIFIAFGIVSLGNTLDQNNNPKKGYEEAGIGAFLLLPSLLGLVFFSNVFAKIPFIIVLVFGIILALLGIIKLFNIRQEQKSSNHTSEKPLKEQASMSPGKIGILIVSVIAFLSNLVTIIAFFIK